MKTTTIIILTTSILLSASIIIIITLCGLALTDAKYKQEDDPNHEIYLYSLLVDENSYNGLYSYKKELNTKYYCGAIRISFPNETLNYGLVTILEEDEHCSEQFSKIDHGWFKRVREYCCTSCDNPIPERFNNPVCKLKGYSYVLSFMIVCNAPILFFLISFYIIFIDDPNNESCKKGLIIAEVALLAAIMIIGIGLFAPSWTDIRKLNAECLDNFCIEIRNQGKKSSEYFLGAFLTLLISHLGAIILNLYVLCFGFNPNPHAIP